MSEIDLVIELIIRKFINLFNKKYCISNKYLKENRNILGNGYCLFLAMLLKKIFPEGEIINTGYDHCIFKYANDYYDYRGKIVKFDNIIEVFPGYYVPLKGMYAMNEDDINLFLEICNSYYAAVWNEFEPILLNYASKIAIKTDYLRKLVKNPSK